MDILNKLNFIDDFYYNNINYKVIICPKENEYTLQNLSVIMTELGNWEKLIEINNNVSSF